jgi:hypothetical protein
VSFRVENGPSHKPIPQHELLDPFLSPISYLYKHPKRCPIVLNKLLILKVLILEILLEQSTLVS